VDFEDSPADAAFRAEARTWLKEHAEEATSPADWSRNPDHPDYAWRCREWQKTLFEGGWAAITWPVEYGGRGQSPWHQTMFNQEASRFNVSNGVLSVGLGMCGPMLIAHGTEEQKQRHLTAMVRGEAVWCQLFSEPDAGSDLAALKTSAVRDGETFVVNGQKVWSSNAQHSDWAILLARSDPEAPKHKGISYFLVDMRSPGIEVRPLVQISGHAHFNEVFLNDVHIPAANIIGEVNGGWGPVMTTLAHERTMIGGSTGGYTTEAVIDLARRSGRTGDPAVRQELARLYARTQVMRYMNLRVQTAASRGVVPGPEASVMKLYLSRHSSLTADLLMEILGPAAMLHDDDAPDAGTWQTLFLNQWRVKIGGGTDQVQANALGERVLGLPPEPRVDKNVPFNQLTTSRARESELSPR
jgi:alkylation response protein AidB-like acyl-CoA dehydrogenase